MIKKITLYLSQFKDSFLQAGNPKEIVGIQTLRFFAALFVVVDHLFIHYSEHGGFSSDFLDYAYALGHVGVCMFFAISGYVMVLTNQSKFNVPGNAIDFFIRRLIRILPLYAIATFIVFALKHHTDNVYNFLNLFKSLTFIPYIGENELYRPIVGKGWTLNYEMFFYSIFALCLCLPRRVGLLLTITVLLLLPISSFFFNFKDTYLIFYRDKIILFFLVGVVVALLTNYTRLRGVYTESAPRAATLGVVLLVLGVLLNESGLSTLIKFLTLIVLIFFALLFVCNAKTKFKNILVSNLLTKLGDASYSIYLFHGFVFPPLKFLVLKSSTLFLNSITLIVMVIVGVIFGLFVHILLEKPMQNYLLSIYRKSTS